MFLLLEKSIVAVIAYVILAAASIVSAELLLLILSENFGAAAVTPSAPGSTVTLDKMREKLGPLGVSNALIIGSDGCLPCGIARQRCVANLVLGRMTTLLQAFYTIRSERQLMEQLRYNLLYRWFVGMGVDDPVWVPTVGGRWTNGKDLRTLPLEQRKARLAKLLV